MPDEPLDPELNEFSQMLSRLAPAPAVLDRDRVLYEAGRRSLRGKPWGWMTAAAFAGLSLVQFMQSPSHQATQVATVIPESHPVVEPAPSIVQIRLAPQSSGYIELRNRVSQIGVNALPTTAIQRVRANEQPWTPRTVYREES